jgi:phage tail-like protein
MRGTIPGLRSSQPLGAALPELYRRDDFTQRLMSAIDELLAPVLSTLDDLDAYFDALLAPEDFLLLLAGWLGVPAEEVESGPRRRALVALAVELYRWQGTRRGIAEVVRLYTGVEPEIEDSGGVSWSASPGSPAPGDQRPSLTVRVRPPDGVTVDPEHLDAIVAAIKPAHVPHRVEVLP